VAGKVKTRSGAVRELAAFAQFGSDLDARQKRVLIVVNALSSFLSKNNTIQSRSRNRSGDVGDAKRISRSCSGRSRKEFQSKLQDYLETRKEGLLRSIREKNSSMKISRRNSKLRSMNSKQPGNDLVVSIRINHGLQP